MVRKLRRIYIIIIIIIYISSTILTNYDYG